MKPRWTTWTTRAAPHSVDELKNLNEAFNRLRAPSAARWIQDARPAAELEARLDALQAQIDRIFCTTR